jgi:enolase-phosphatase E1
MPTFRVAALVLDIEGTTSSLSFVKDTLFPYAKERLTAYVTTHSDTLTDILTAVAQTEGRAEVNTAFCIKTLHRWMDEDKKITPLKELQGLIWQEGYRNGTLQGHIYNDAYDFLQAYAMTIPTYIYSSGSVAAQKLLFGYTNYGDLTSYFKGYFDTTSGAKTDSTAYKRIAEAINLPADTILFVSDNPLEIDAARQAGWQACHIVREGDGRRPRDAIADFTELKVIPL